jgi:hypothetical protein
MAQLGILAGGYFSDIIPNLIFLIGETIGLISIIIFVNKIKLRPRNWIGLVIFSFYFFYVLFNYLRFSISAYNFPDQYVKDGLSIFFTVTALIMPIFSTYVVFKVFAEVSFKGKNLGENILRIYLSLVTFLMASLLLLTLMDIGKWTFYDYISCLSLMILLIGLLSYITRKIIFSVKYWKIYFWTSAIWTLLELLYYLGLKNFVSIPVYLRSYTENNEPVSSIIYLIISPFIISLYYPLYRIAYDKKFFKSSSN